MQFEIAWRACPLVLVCLLMYLSCETSRHVWAITSFLNSGPCDKDVLGVPSETREFKHILAYTTTFVNEVFPSLNIRLQLVHSDGGAGLIAAEVLGFHHKSGVTTSHLPYNTPQMNLVTERWVRSLKEKVLCMLLHSTLPVAFWWFAVDCPMYSLNRLLTKTALGNMSLYECVVQRLI